jgi:UDP-glucose 4-epimerase
MSLYCVTGGAGIIGSALARELLRRGERIRVVDNFLPGKRENLADSEWTDLRS